MSIEPRLPILEPDLNRPFSHVDLVSYSVPDLSGGCGVLVEFDLECGQLILGRSLSLLVLLLLGERALPWRTPR